MSFPSTSSGQTPWPPQRPSRRIKLRNGTFIIPGTGERSRRQFSLRGPTLESADADRFDYKGIFSQSTLGDGARAIAHNAKASALRFAAWLPSPSGRNVLKCTLAYFLGTMGTFLPPVARFLGNSDGKHIVATITVYFHPARTAGSMLEAVLMAIVAVAYAELVILLAMGIAVLFASGIDVPVLGHILVLLVCVGAGLGLMGWLKQRANNELVNTASTLAAIGIIGVVTREDSVHGGEFSGVKIIQMLKMLVMGISISAGVNLLLWRDTARAVLRRKMAATSVSLGDMLSMITRGFLNGSEDEFLSGAFAQVAARHKADSTKMNLSLRESKFEYYFLGREKVYHIDKVVAKSLETLAQAVGGLRSASNTQFALLRERPNELSESGQLSPGTSVFSPTLTRAMSSYIKNTGGKPATLAAIDEREETDAESPEESQQIPKMPRRSSLLRSTSEIFELFIELLGPSMKSLAYTLSEILREQPFGSDPDYKICINERFTESLADALRLYDEARANALHELYRTIEFGRSRSKKMEADIEEVAAACGHFSFSLQSVAEDMQGYLEVLRELKDATGSTARSWEWLKFWTYIPWPKPASIRLGELEHLSLLEEQPVVKPLRRSQVPRGIPENMISRRDSFAWNAAPESNRILRSISQKFLKGLRVLARDDIRFGIKVGIGAVLWGSLAFMPVTRPLYAHYRGEWGLLSFIIVCTVNVGSSNTAGTSRFLGTIIGASLSLAGWTISGGNGPILAFFCWFMAMWNFYLILAGNGPLGRITLLAWNVTLLYAYSLSQRVDEGDEDEGGTTPHMFEIFYHRVTAVTLGILWGLVVCRVVWPISGRRKFKEGLSVLYLQLGLIWKRGPLAILLRSDNTKSYMKEGEQRALARYTAKLEALRKAAKNEFALTGPFPSEAYGRIMHATHKMLDGFHAMRLVTTRRQRLSAGEAALLRATAVERAQLCERVCHVFQVLASSLMLEYPLTDAVPSVVGIKDRLLGRIHHFRKDHSEEEDGAGGGSSRAAAEGEPAGVQERDYALLYAYTLVTAQVAEELERVQKEIENLFGVLDDDAMLLQ